MRLEVQRWTCCRYYISLIFFLSAVPLRFAPVCKAAEGQIAKFVDPEAFTNGWFGTSVALGDGLVFVGSSPLPESNGPAGSVSLFSEDASGQWQFFQELIPSDIASGDRFGTSVALSGDYFIASASIAIPGTASRAGSVYAFEKAESGEWIEADKLTPPTPVSFSGAIAIDGNTLVVGAGDMAPNGEVGGRAYVYRRNELGSWDQVATLKPSDAEAKDGFGFCSVGISGDKIIVGSYLDDNVAHEAGSAYIFEEDANGSWNQTAKLIASDASTFNWFGSEVGISGDTAVVGSLYGGNYGDRSGKVYVFQSDEAGGWVEREILVPSDGIVGTGLGKEIAISGDLIVCGALTDDQGQFTGSAFAFRRDDNGDWQQIAKLIANDAAAEDHFGYSSLSIHGGRVLVGSFVDDHSGYEDAGSAYLFRVPEAPAKSLVLVGLASLLLYNRSVSRTGVVRFAVMRRS
ncbi:MAG: hypothetical protein C0485_19305 [Pirellula sp.]|nr:hypothetical protein [Pirellula sp.]